MYPNHLKTNKLKSDTSNKIKKTKVGNKLKIIIGPDKLTRFEKARIIGARSLQLSLGAPPFIPFDSKSRDPIALAVSELESHSPPMSIRRSLPDGTFQDIPVDELL